MKYRIYWFCPDTGKKGEDAFRFLRRVDAERHVQFQNIYYAGRFQFYLREGHDNG